MTTKDFQFKLAKFSLLNIACHILMDNQHLNFIYRVVGFTNQKTSIETYVPFPEATSESVYHHVFEFLYYDKFTRHDFLIQFKYFKTFMRSISENQKIVLTNSHQVDHLLVLFNTDDFTEACVSVSSDTIYDDDKLPF